MTILQRIRAEITKSLKSGERDKLSILRLILGESQLKNDDSDPVVEAIIRKMIKNNKETIKAIQDIGEEFVDIKTAVFNAENSFLESFLPQGMTENEIVDFINIENIDFSSVNNSGQAVGMVIKRAKAAGKNVDGNTVKIVVEKILSK